MAYKWLIIVISCFVYLNHKPNLKNLNQSFYMLQVNSKDIKGNVNVKTKDTDLHNQ